MSPEDKMRESDAELVDLHQEVVAKLKATTEDRTLLEQTRLLAAVALTARRMHGTLGASHHRMRAHIQANAMAIKASTLKASALKARAAHPAANENDTDASLEMEMDDDSGRTPERVEEVRAEIRRRLALLGDARESKSVDGGGAVVGGGALHGGVAGVGGAPETPG